VPIDDARTYAIIGAAMEVHRHMGRGFLEAAYQRALEMELADRGIPHQSQVEVPLAYKGRSLGVHRRADLLVDGILVELKALPRVGREERTQVTHYLRAMGKPVGLLLNFGEDSLHVERVVSP
jgi:GxxExxY protein